LVFRYGLLFKSKTKGCGSLAAGIYL